MSIVIEIHPGSQVRVIDYTDRTGRPARMSKQDAYVHLLDKSGQPKPYPEAMSLMVPRGPDGIPQPFAPGRYTLHPSSFYLDRYQSLVVAPKLVPVASK